MSKVFRAKYVAELISKKIADNNLPQSLFSKNWVVHAKRPFGEPKQAIEYLGRYTHKVTISNSRIKNVSSSEVSFTYKDYRDNGITKLMLLANTEFIRRFAQHILPKRFVRIRHYGILSSSWKRGRIQQLQLSLNIECRPQKIAKCCVNVAAAKLVRW